MKKKTLKRIAIVSGVLAECCLISLAIVGAGTIMTERYHDPEHYIRTVIKSTQYGFGVGTNLVSIA